MNRRDAIFKVAGIMGATISTPFLMGLTNYHNTLTDQESKVNTISDNHKKMIAEISELIIPTTKTPGAKAAKVPEFVIMMIADCYTKEDQERFYSGLDNLDNKIKSITKKGFLQSNAVQQISLLKETEIEARDIKKADPKTVTPFFLMIKELVLFGYFTSEIGSTQALAYDPIPGSYKACVPLKPGQKAWAT